jgi:catechol 2,3-dioxygenase-like lactoylglutathione lyase family enzyme
MLRIGSINMKVSDIGRAAEFWGSALGYGLRGGAVNEGESAFLVPPASEGPQIALDENDRMHLDLYVDSDKELVSEVDRLISLGARRADWAYPEEATFVVLADTEGNLFCVAKVSEG